MVKGWLFFNMFDVRKIMSFRLGFDLKLIKNLIINIHGYLYTCIINSLVT